MKIFVNFWRSFLTFVCFVFSFWAFSDSFFGNTRRTKIEIKETKGKGQSIKAEEETHMIEMIDNENDQLY